MKRKDQWREKLDAAGIDFVEGYRKFSEVRGRITDEATWRTKVSEIVAAHPELRKVAIVEVVPEFLRLLTQNEEIANLISPLDPKPGSKAVPPPVARCINVMQTTTLALEDPQMRIAAGFLAGIVALFFGNVYEDLSRGQFGDKGPSESKEFLWAIGTTLEILGKMLKSEKIPDLKGKVNIELVNAIKNIRERQTTKLSYRELFQALEYAGIHVSDEETLRVFEWRARKRGWLSADNSSKSKT